MNNGLMDKADIGFYNKWGCSSGTVDFYHDGTYNIANTLQGTYSIVHDGKALLMVNQWGQENYFDFEISGGVLYIQNERNNLITFEKACGCDIRAVERG